MTRVRARCRLHLGLFDLAGVSGRKYGGVGLSIQNPNTSVVASLAAAPVVSGEKAAPAELLVAIEEAMGRLSLAVPRCPWFSIHVEAVVPSHVGLGSKTATVLAALMAANIEGTLGLSRRDLVQLSQRGGTSGIGVNSFFEGGLVVDAGVRDDEFGAFRPSSASTGGDPPTSLVRLPMPEDWRVTLLLPEGIRWAGGREVEFFNANSPIPEDEALVAIVSGSFALPAAVVEEDLLQFASALHRLQDVGFKAREIGAQPAGVAGVMRRLRQVPGVAAGMSSMGPLIFAVWDVHDSAASASIDKIASETSTEVLVDTSFDNAGWGIE